MSLEHKLARLRKDERGFSLPEVLVTMLMMLTVMFALYSIFDMSLRVFSYGNDKLEAVENARVGLERMEREIRAAYPYSEGDDELLKDWESGRIMFGNNTDDNAGITIPDEEIIYKLSAGEPHSLLRINPSDALIPDPVIEYVANDGLSFRYFKSDGTTEIIPGTGNESDIAIVRIKLEVKKQGQQDATQTLTTDVHLRNRSDDA